MLESIQFYHTMFVYVKIIVSYDYLSERLIKLLLCFSCRLYNQAVPQRRDGQALSAVLPACQESRPGHYDADADVFHVCFGEARHLRAVRGRRRQRKLKNFNRVPAEASLSLRRGNRRGPRQKLLRMSIHKIRQKFWGGPLKRLSYKKGEKGYPFRHLRACGQEAEGGILTRHEYKEKRFGIFWGVGQNSRHGHIAALQDVLPRVEICVAAGVAWIRRFGRMRFGLPAQRACVCASGGVLQEE